MKKLMIITSFMIGFQLSFGQTNKIDTSFYSESLGMTKLVDVYLPPGYDEHPDLYYPVIYYLHAWLSNQDEMGGMFSWANFLINSNITDPFIMVCADNSPGPFLGSCYMNSIIWGDYEDYMVNDLVDWIESSFRVVPHKYYRSLMGTSMGGFGSFRLGLLHHDHYCALAAHAAEMNFDLFIEDIRQELLIENTGPPYFYNWDNNGFFTQWMFVAGGAFSPNYNTSQNYINPPIVEFPFDENCTLIDTVYQQWKSCDIPAILSTVSPSDSIGILFSCGENDPLHIYPANLAMKDTLDAHGFSCEFYSHTGGHGMPGEFKQRAIIFLDSIMGAPLPYTRIDHRTLPAQQGNLLIYPNPAFSLITIETNSFPGDISILDLSGRLILNRQVTEPETVIDISTLPRGVYVVRVQDENRILTRKLIKQ